MYELLKKSLRSETPNLKVMHRAADATESLKTMLAGKETTVHGHWKQVNHDGSWKVCACSVCKKRTHFVNYAEAYNFCPNCGAKMNELI